MFFLNRFFRLTQSNYMNRSIGNGALILVISGIICKLFGAFFRFPLTNVLGINGIAIFQMTMSLYSLAVVFLSNGVTNSLAKLVASSRARGEAVKSGAYLKLAIKYVLILGFSLGVIFLLFSRQIASLQGVSGGNSYKLMFLLLPLGGLIGVYRGIIQGHENMTPTAISQIIEQVSRFAFGLSFAYVFGKQGADRGVFGAFLGITISEILSFAYLHFVLSKKMNISFNDLQVKQEFFSAVLPLSFSSGVIPLAHAIESLIILKLLGVAGIEMAFAQKLYGLQTGMIGTILSFPLLLSLAIGMAMLPKISYLSSTGSSEEEKNIIEKAFSLMWAILIPLVLGICSVSKEFYTLVYPNLIGGLLGISEGLTYITAFSIIITAIMQFLISLLQAKGYFKEVLVFSILGGIVKLLTLIIFARMKGIGIYAIPLSNALLSLTISLCAVIKLYSYVKVDFFNICLPLLSGFIMFMAVKLLISSVGGVWGIILAVISGGGVYLVLTLPLWLEFLKDIKYKLKNSKKHLEN